MEIFYNNVRPNYEEIVSYGPRWWTEYREMDANYRFAGWTLDLMAYFLEQTIKNQFPMQADENTIAMFERLLRIEYDAEMSLDERRRTVAAYYSGTGHLSRSVILSLIKTYTGHDGEVYWDGLRLCIAFDNSSTRKISIALLQKILDRRMPAHIDYRTMCTCRVKLGIKASKMPWNVVFVLTGTLPKTSTGLTIRAADIEIQSEGTGHRVRYPKAGESGPAGVYPILSTALSILKNDVEVLPDTEGYKVEYIPSGEDTETGMEPRTSTGLAVAHEGVEVQPSAESYLVSSAEAGTEPKTSTGYDESEGGVLPEVKTESWQVDFTLCGDDSGL